MDVILVDDELLMRIGLKSMINWEEYGFQVVGEAANGKEALDIARRHPPDLIITDIKMPVMDGLELIREASKLLGPCQYVILSCLDEFQFAKEALKLGAADYLIKSDIKPQQLLEVLDSVKRKVTAASQRSEDEMLKINYKDSISYLKETLFKELFSGFLNEDEAIRRSEALHIMLEQGPMILVKLRVDRFEDIRQKYIEQDEKLFRYSIMNIMEEIIPRKWRKEIIALNSAEYALVVNVNDDAAEPGHFNKELDKLLAKIQAAMKDFLNLSLSIGVSGPIPGYNGLKKAYGEADEALQQLFFLSECQIRYYDRALRFGRSREDHYSLSRDDEQNFLKLVENDGEGAESYLELLKQRLVRNDISEQGVRTTYLRLLSLITSCFPGTPELWNEGRSLYEQFLIEERLEGLHRLLLRVLEQCLEYNDSQGERPQSYAEQACTIIQSQFAEDISLQTVAMQINVNPSYLSRIFKQEMGENFVTYLTRVRIKKAQHYLRDRNFKVYEVADKVGYPNTAYFSKIFKKMTGMSPEEYRG